MAECTSAVRDGDHLFELAAGYQAAIASRHAASCTSRDPFGIAFARIPDG